MGRDAPDHLPNGICKTAKEPGVHISLTCLKLWDQIVSDVRTYFILNYMETTKIY